ncbi:MAG: hypothetical protein A2W82_06005 [Sulfurimonas sp. RIFCSPLOWO2_12_36_12]|uniref:hypothetical protein n=1 Tax=Sulfurimonas sp. RIFCSPLOWO2_12_36_12 TaxID=1802253 RepID=UPI0008B2D0CE|nr:hypothetical protein [Sulfurimonas sp. RIFCSPLOWO2_12_36_12]OHE02631.1 MAG: hypothetical protein A2W82_06005 [Sulfurimonas sp. RIFCSPLOWO2_12_36_12]
MNREYISNMASDLTALAEILNKEGIDTSQFYIISGQLKQPPLKYKLTPFKIDIKDDQKFPKRLSHRNSARNLELFFDLEIECDTTNFGSNRDPFKQYSFNVVIKGKNKNNANSKLIYAIHFDKHNFIEQQEGELPNQAHPTYHFQFAGNKLEDEEKLDSGRALFLDAPRIMHHPMDLILGIDFILSNFFPKIWHKVKLIPTYKKILKKYQKDFILPYFKSIVQHLEGTTNEWNAQEIYPQLIGR